MLPPSSISGLTSLTRASSSNSSLGVRSALSIFQVLGNLLILLSLLASLLLLLGLLWLFRFGLGNIRNGGDVSYGRALVVDNVVVVVNFGSGAYAELA
ncbi:hypothetical protein HYQ46_007303 [Verticillium longisporum]|nr:hypothetical protein HYQ46_007303 [Verticillium longisporum]